MNKLTGFALPAWKTQGVKNWKLDHTYVADDTGRAWGCNGRVSGGIPICSGLGNGNHADCLAQPNRKAGIIYGLGGVCHQMANRILLSANVQVSQARGYSLSLLLFGEFGLDQNGIEYDPITYPWPELAYCSANHNH
ncbi:hypothetical protein [Thalassospira sp. MCCC 1A03138]|uniref:hypothetical protein n=1 Tax=Thalassospira sp. MCCC 1A03138 TaxID=1470576 RepID=UPI00111BCF2B|nr:hypothetical protein [Thalassospira sp. MCCC 1A03138]